MAAGERKNGRRGDRSLDISESVGTLYGETSGLRDVLVKLANDPLIIRAVQSDQVKIKAVILLAFRCSTSPKYLQNDSLLLLTT